MTPRCRLSDEQVRLVDEVSRELLQDPGLLCAHKEVIESFRAAGVAKVSGILPQTLASNGKKG